MDTLQNNKEIDVKIRGRRGIIQDGRYKLTAANTGEDWEIRSRLPDHSQSPKSLNWRLAVKLKDGRVEVRYRSTQNGAFETLANFRELMSS